MPGTSSDSLAETSVLRIQPGDRVDLESCPYLRQHASARWEYGVVTFVERETDDCVVIGYEGIDHIGYPAGTVLRVRQPAVQPVQ